MLTFEKLLKNLQFIKFAESIYSERSFIDLELWEQREVISFFTSEELATTPAHKLIVYNISNNIEYTWNTLSIVDEAIIQRELRIAGYELTCHGMNTFPTSVTELRSYCVIYTNTTTGTTNKQYQNNKLTDNVGSLLADYQYLIMTIFLIIMLYMGYINIIGGFIVAYIITAILSFFMHEYAQHNSRYGSSNQTILIKSWFNWPVHILAYLYLPSLSRSTTPSDIGAHVVHHQVWKTDVDGIMGSIKENWVRHLCNPPLHAGNKNSIELMNKVDLSLHKSKWLFNDFLVDNRIYILSIIHLMFIFVFGITAYVSYLIFPIWYFIIIVSATSDFYFHSPKRNPPKDGPWWTVPIWFNLSYHISHHAEPSVLFFGEGWIKYINLQYWIFLLAYTTNEKNSNRIY